jgi:hypothetical protein
MRELKRSIAKARMRDAGIKHLFKRGIAVDYTDKRHHGKPNNRRISRFSKYWREFAEMKPQRARKLARRAK